VETNISDEWFCHGVEKTIVNNDHQRRDNVVTLRKLRVSNVVFANLVVFSDRFGIFFVAHNLTFKFIWELINSISSIVFISDPESTFFVFIITEARESSVDIVSSGSVKISGFIKVLPGVIGFFLVFNLSKMWDFS
jgi:hypothetical protein